MWIIENRMWKYLYDESLNYVRGNAIADWIRLRMEKWRIKWKF